MLVANLRTVVGQLWQVGISDIFIDGSFVEDKPKPADIDGYFLCSLLDLLDGTLQRRLNQIDPNHCWTWENAARRPHPSSTKLQLPMWHAYRVEMYPHVGQLTGIRDQQGNELMFPAAFRQQRDTFVPKGIVRIIR